MEKARTSSLSLAERTENPKDAKATSTAFILMFPALILAGLAVFYAPLGISLISVCLAIYQFLMIKKFIEDYYKGR